MSTSLEWAISVPTAVCAAASFGLAGFLQHQATQLAPPSGPLRPGLLVDLIRIPQFRWGVLLGALGFALQVVALRFGPLALVQPLLVTGVLFYLLYASASRHHLVERGLFVGAFMALAGLVGFLVVARPAPGHGAFSGSAALPLGVALVGIVSLCLFIASRLHQEVRAVPIAAATAVCYGVTAGLVRDVLSMPDIVTVITHWQVYAIIVVAPAGFLLNQNAFQQGRLGSVSVATITVGDPVVAMGVGAAWLGESLRSGVWQTPLEIVMLALMAAGIVVLAGRAQQVADSIRAGQREPAEARR